MTTQQNKLYISIPERLALEDELTRKVSDKITSRIKVAEPGIVVSFNKDAETITALIAVTEDVVINGILQRGIKIKELYDVPIVIPRAGGYCVTLPIQVGDECLLIFADKCIDAWWENSGVQNQIDKRRHDLSDAFAVMGCWSQPKVIPNYSVDSVQVRNDSGTAYVEIKGDDINILTTGVINISSSTSVNIVAPAINLNE